MTISHSKTNSYEIFNAIAGRYDFINSVLSMGLHAKWRKAIRMKMPNGPGLRVLDLATGTADVALELVKDPNVDRVDGIDMSEQMIRLGQVKVEKRQLTRKIKLAKGDAQAIPADDCTYDAATISFGIRNVADVKACLSECFRVLKPNGRMLILEFALPRQALFRRLYLFYLRSLLPVIGKVLSGHDIAYRYLNETIEDFPYGEKFVELLESAGFESAGYRSLSMGIVNLYWGDKR